MVTMSVSVLVNEEKNWYKAFGFSSPNHAVFSNKGCKRKTTSMRLLSRVPLDD